MGDVEGSIHYLDRKRIIIINPSETTMVEDEEDQHEHMTRISNDSLRTVVYINLLIMLFVNFCKF